MFLPWVHVPRVPQDRCPVWVLAGALLCACAPGAADPGWIELEQMRPRSRVGVFLNEPLTLHFSAPVDHASVTRESIRIQSSEDGSPARGHFDVIDETVRFLPDLPTRPDLADAGFQPAARYVVEVRGFPHLDGIRALDGRPLVATYRWFLETAAPSEDGSPAQLFDDRTPAWGAPLRPQSRTVQVDQPLLLESEEPLDPRTLPAAGFLLRPEGIGARIPVEASLLVNSDPGERPGRDRTVLALRPRAPLEPRAYLLTQERGGLRDFGGNPVLLHGDRLLGLRFDVVPAGPGEFHVETFLGTEGRSPVAVPGVDGTAHWSGDGLVSVRLPAASGSGRAGRVELEGELALRDLHTVSLLVPHGREATLTSEGLVVLRSQGSLVIDGRLSRPAGGPSTLGELEPATAETLSDWLERARDLDAPWTVLIAGGDLSVRGELDVAGPLLLVAGGLLRLPGSGRITSRVGFVRLLGDGGGPGSPSTAGRMALAIDEPLINPLAERMAFAVLSGPIPVTGGVSRWVDSFVNAEARGGRVEVLFVPDDSRLDDPMEEWGARAHVAGLGDAPRLRILVRIEVDPPDPRGTGPVPPPNTLWNPPVVDDVTLIFERSTTR